MLTGDPTPRVQNILPAAMTIGPVTDDMAEEARASATDADDKPDNIDGDRIMQRLLAGEDGSGQRSRHLAIIPAGEETLRIDFRPQNVQNSLTAEPPTELDEKCGAPARKNSSDCQFCRYQRSADAASRSYGETTIGPDGTDQDVAKRR